jgi:transcription termination factor Rho
MLVPYLESKFEHGMSWDNYGEWHIDHIVPISIFNLENPEELQKACHYTNLQPLWAEDNLRKGSYYEQ